MTRSIPLLLLLGAMLGIAACDSPTRPSSGPQLPPPPAVEGDTVTTESGLRYIEIEEGEGTPAARGHEVRVAYTLWLEDGTGIEQGTIPWFTLGSANLIQGFTEGIVGMREGGRRRLLVPPELGYGAQGSGAVPPDASLIFDVELLERRTRSQ